MKISGKSPLFLCSHLLDSHQTRFYNIMPPTLKDRTRFAAIVQSSSSRNTQLKQMWRKAMLCCGDSSSKRPSEGISGRRKLALYMLPRPSTRNFVTDSKGYPRDSFKHLCWGRSARISILANGKATVCARASLSLRPHSADASYRFPFYSCTTRRP